MPVTRWRLTTPIGGFADYESAWCCLQKLTWLNHTTGPGLLGVLTDPGAPPSIRFATQQMNLNRPSAATREAFADLLGEAGTTSERRFTDAYNYPGSAGRCSEILRYCRNCIAQGFHCAVTQHLWLHRCPVHPQFELLDACETCGAAIPYTPALVSLARPFTCANGHMLWPTVVQDIGTRHLHTAPDTGVVAAYFEYTKQAQRDSKIAWRVYPILSEQAASLVPTTSRPAPEMWARCLGAPFAAMFGGEVALNGKVELRLTRREKFVLRRANTHSTRFAPCEQLIIAVVRSAIESVFRQVLRHTLAVHRMCFSVPAVIVRELLERSRVPCAAIETLAVWSWAIGTAPAETHRCSRRFQQLWPRRADEVPANQRLAHRLVMAGLELECLARGAMQIENPLDDGCLTAKELIATLARIAVAHSLTQVYECLMKAGTYSIPWREIATAQLVPFVHCAFESQCGFTESTVEAWEALETKVSDLGARMCVCGSDHESEMREAIESWIVINRHSRDVHRVT